MKLLKSEEWLKTNNKKPWFYKGYWYWGLKDSSNESEDQDMVLPEQIFSIMSGKLTYNNVIQYNSEEEALKAFHNAYEEEKYFLNYKEIGKCNPDNFYKCDNCGGSELGEFNSETGVFEGFLRIFEVDNKDICNICLQYQFEENK